MPSTATDRLNGTTTSVALKAPVKTVTSANITLAGLQTIGGVALAEGDRVLVKDQTDQTENGIYLASTSDWTRSLDFDGNRDAVKGTLVVTDGVSTALLFYRLTTVDPVIIGTSAITFVQASEVQNPYPRTQAEIAAGVTPTDYAYPEANLLRYGADPLGVSSSDTAIRNAIKVAREKRSLTGATSVEVFWPDGLYTGTAGVPIVTGVAHRCASRWSATYECTGTGAAAWTATYAAGVFTDNLAALQANIQDGSKSVENASIVNILFDHAGAIAGNAPSGAAWASVVQLNGAPHIVLDSIYAASTTNDVNGISVSLSWRARIRNTWTPRQNTYSGGVGLLIDNQGNSVYIEAPFVFGDWDIGIDVGGNSITVIEPNVESCTVGVRLTGVQPRLLGGYYEGNGTDIRMGIASSPVDRALVERPWCNGAGSTYSIDVLAAINSEIIEPYFTGTYSTSKFKTTASASENYGNRIRIHAADANNPGLAGLGLVGGRNLIEVIGQDNDDHRLFVHYKSSDGTQAEQQLNQRGAGFVSFVLKIENAAGTLKASVHDGDGNSATYIAALIAGSETAANVADVASGVAFGTCAAGRLSGSNNIVVLNTHDQGSNAEISFQAVIAYNDTATALAVERRVRSRNVNGVTAYRPEIVIRNGATGAAFNFDTTNFTAGKSLHIHFSGFMK